MPPPEPLRYHSDKRESLPQSGVHRNIPQSTSPVHISAHLHRKLQHPSRDYVCLPAVSADQAPHRLPAAPIVDFSKVDVFSVSWAHVPASPVVTRAAKSETPAHTTSPPVSVAT